MITPGGITPVAGLSIPRIAAGGGGSAYDAAVLADNPLIFYEMKEPSGTVATDASPHAANGTYQGTVTLAQPGPCSDGEKAVLLDGSTGYVSTPSSFVNPSPWSVEIWFKSTSVVGGALVSFNSNATGGAPSFDRELVLNNDGSLQFGSAQTLCASAGPWNDGNWHHVAGTFDPVAPLQALYVDGVSRATFPGAALNNYTGWWRIGNAAGTGGWGTATSAFIAGTLAKAAIYNTVLSPARVTAHYAAR